MVVIIIIGILAIVAIINYQTSVEKSRSAEAKTIIGTMRSQCGAYFSRDGTTDACTGGNMLIGSGQGMVPGPDASQCRQSHFFWYNVSQVSPDRLAIIATRCVNGAGKSPSGTAPAQNLTLTVNFTSGADDWSGNY